MEIEMEMQNQTQYEFNNNDADDENSVNTIDYVNDVENDVFIDKEEENKQELYNLIDKLKYFTLNENKIIIYQSNQPYQPHQSNQPNQSYQPYQPYQPNQPNQSYQPYYSTPEHCIIQMEF